MKYTRVGLPIGDGQKEVEIPNVIGVISPPEVPGVQNAREEIARAIKNPLGCPPLREIARGKRNAVIVVNDITRPYPGGLILEGIIRELKEAGLTEERISLLIAYGNHRINTKEELSDLYGAELIQRLRIIHHRATEEGTLTTVGYTKRGVKVQVNKDYTEADLKIITGCITPHQLAGYSGGRKSILPGIAGLDSLKAHHSFPIRPPVTSMGWLAGNRFHEDALDAAYLVGVDFIVNSVDNAQRELVACVAGELDMAHRKGVEICAGIWTVDIPCKPDIVLVSPGGFPRDIDLHQSQKALGSAEMICREGGQIILCGEMRDGAGKPGRVLTEAQDPAEIIERFLKEGYTPDGTSKAYMLARAMKHFNLSVAGSMIPSKDLEKMFIAGYDTPEEAIDAAIKRYGIKAKVLVIPHASEIIPVIKEDKG